MDLCVIVMYERVCSVPARWSQGPGVRGWRSMRYHGVWECLAYLLSEVEGQAYYALSWCMRECGVPARWSRGPGVLCVIMVYESVGRTCSVKSRARRTMRYHDVWECGAYLLGEVEGQPYVAIYALSWCMRVSGVPAQWSWGPGVLCVIIMYESVGRTCSVESRARRMRLRIYVLSWCMRVWRTCSVKSRARRKRLSIYALS